MKRMEVVTGDDCSLGVLRKYLHMAKCNSNTCLPSTPTDRSLFHITELLQQKYDKKMIGDTLSWTPILDLLVDTLEDYEHK